MAPWLGFKDYCLYDLNSTIFEAVACSGRYLLLYTPGVVCGSAGAPFDIEPSPLRLDGISSAEPFVYRPWNVFRFATTSPCSLA